MRIQCSIPTSGLVSSKFAESLAALAKRRDITIAMEEGTNWITNREKLARKAVDDGFSHILFIDDDIIFTVEAFDSLVSRGVDVALCNYRVKGAYGKFCAIAPDRFTPVRTEAASTGLEEVAFAGLGFALISTRTFKRVEQPWFMPGFVPAISEYTTEDLAFFHRARLAGILAYVDHDASKGVRHIGRISFGVEDGG